jgi:Putative prokaryotic signal transducing protein
MANDPLDAVSVFKALNVAEAHLVKDLLLQEGIEATVTDEHEPLAGLSIVPPDVMVRIEDEPHAREIVADYLRRRETKDIAPDWTCPNCGEQVPATFELCFRCGASRPKAI